MSSAADRLLKVLATEVQSAIILSTKMEAVCLQVKQQDAELATLREAARWRYGADEQPKMGSKVRRWWINPLTGNWASISCSYWMGPWKMPPDNVWEYLGGEPPEDVLARLRERSEVEK